MRFALLLGLVPFLRFAGRGSGRHHLRSEFAHVIFDCQVHIDIEFLQLFVCVKGLFEFENGHPSRIALLDGFVILYDISDERAVCSGVFSCAPLIQCVQFALDFRSQAICFAGPTSAIFLSLGDLAFVSEDG